MVDDAAVVGEVIGVVVAGRVVMTRSSVVVEEGIAAVTGLDKVAVGGTVTDGEAGTLVVLDSACVTEVTTLSGEASSMVGSG